MYEIVSKQILRNGIYKVHITAPQAVRRFKPGQCVIVAPNQFSRRIIFTTVAVKKDIVSIIFKEDDESTKALADMKIGQKVYAVLGPLGNPIETVKKKKIACLSEEIGAAAILSICRYLKTYDNKITGMAGFSDKRQIILESYLRLNCHKMFMATLDGSYEKKGTVADLFIEKSQKEKFDIVYMDVSLKTLIEIMPFLDKKKTVGLFNLTGLLSRQLRVSDMDTFFLKTKRYSFYYDGPYINIDGLDIHYLENQVNFYKEHKTCQSKNSSFSLQKNGSGIFPRLLSGLIKDRL